jgi:FkbM family methyltransferase
MLLAALPVAVCPGGAELANTLMSVKRRLLSLVSRFTGLVRPSFPVMRDQEEFLIQAQFATAAELSRLRDRPRTETVLLGKPTAITDCFWYLHSLKEIFADETYKFRAKRERPVILDCGSNIGLSLIYFKRLYPAAIVTGFEPDPRICDLARKNLAAHGILDVAVENKAVWWEDSTIRFNAFGNLGGRANTSGVDESSTIAVPAVALRSLLKNQP